MMWWAWLFPGFRAGFNQGWDAREALHPEVMAKAYAAGVSQAKQDLREAYETMRRDTVARAAQGVNLERVLALREAITNDLLRAERGKDVARFNYCKGQLDLLRQLHQESISDVAPP